MHVSTQITVVVVLLTYGTLTSQSPVEELNVVLVPSNEDTAPVPKNCTTGHGTPGGCVDRAYCDYGTPAIDFTTYEPKGYQRSCGHTEVCCPFNSQLTILPKKKSRYDVDIDFDDDD